MKQLAQSEWSWTLYEAEGGQLLLSVVCGTVGIFEVEHRLSDEERQSYASDGVPALEAIAKKVRLHPEAHRV